MKKFEELLDCFYRNPKRKHVVIVCPNDRHTEYVVRRCIDEDIADLTLVLDGNESPALSQYCSSRSVAMLSCGDCIEAARKGVGLVHDGLADVLMKGTINTDTLLHAVIDKEHGKGLLQKGKVMSHLTIAEIPSYHKLLMFSDAAVIPAPTIEQFDAMIGYDCQVARNLGITEPKVALIHFTEKTNPRFRVSIDYTTVKQRGSAGSYGDAVIAGPMDVKAACDSDSAKIKDITSTVVGDADILIMPDLEAANTFYKSLSLFANARMAGIITGTSAPVVVPSRADSAESKFYSLIKIGRAHV